MKKFMKIVKTFIFSFVIVVAIGLSGQRAYAESPLHVLKLYAREFIIQPSDTYALAGPVRIMLFNEGAVPHALAIEGIKGTLLRVPPGEVSEVTVKLVEGSYVFYCPVKSHREKGMVGLLKVHKNGWERLK